MDATAYTSGGHTAATDPQRYCHRDPGLRLVVAAIQRPVMPPDIGMSMGRLIPKAKVELATASDARAKVRRFGSGRRSVDAEESAVVAGLSMIVAGGDPTAVAHGVLCGSPSLTTLRRTGCRSARPTPSSRRSRPSATAPSSLAEPLTGWAPSRWSSSSTSRRRGDGGASTTTHSSPMSARSSRTGKPA